MALVLERYDAAAMRERCARSGLLDRLQRKGFTDIRVAVEAVAGGFPHALVFAAKAGRRHLLLDACLREALVRPEDASFRGYAVDRPVELLVVHWVREQDPTAEFGAERPPLPLQKHPGLGVLRDAFHVAVGIAQELNKDAVVSVPKFFHDAFIFYRSRLFLFLDGYKQGWFEALVRDLQPLPLAERSLAIAGWCVRDSMSRVVRWDPGYQVFPISPLLTAYFNSAQYGDCVVRGLQESRFTFDMDALAEVRATVGAANVSSGG